MNPDFDDPDRDRRTFLIEVLQHSRGQDFSLFGTGVSSVLEATDLIIDLLLQLSQLLEEGTSLSEQSNPEIGFSEWHQDALGNPKQFRIVENRKQYWNEPLAKQLRELASSFVGLKRSEFEGSLYLPTLSPSQEVSYSGSKVRPYCSKKNKGRNQKAQKYYNIRHDRRKAEQKNHLNQPLVENEPSSRNSAKEIPRVKGYSSISSSSFPESKKGKRTWTDTLRAKGTLRRRLW